MERIEQSGRDIARDNHHDKYDLEEVTHCLGRMDPNAFERLCCALLPLEFHQWRSIQPSYNAQGKATPGTPDAHVRLDDGSYVAFQFTTQQSGVRQKVLEDIAKITSPSCQIAVRTTTVVVCLNTAVGSEHEEYVAAAAKHNWALELFTLHTLASLLVKHPSIADAYLGTRLMQRREERSAGLQDKGGGTERCFDAGGRVRQVRKDIGLNDGQFIEVVSLQSCNTLRDIEAGKSECPESFLERVAAASGASIEWLKFGKIAAATSSLRHGETTPYPCYGLMLHNVQHALETLREAHPDKLYFCVELRSYKVMLLTQTGDHHWRTFDLGICIDFWRWLDGLGYIGSFYALLDAV